MKVKWDYSDLAKAYLKRPDYSDKAIELLLSSIGLNRGGKCCDVGAGVAHLSLKLAKNDIYVDAVEPNKNMSKYGKVRTKNFSNIDWFVGTGEKTGMPDNTYDLITFGSSFNVTNQEAALLETSRIAKAGGWLAVMWNHRNLDNTIQYSIEKIIKENISGYSYGSRRKDQKDIIDKSNLFHEVNKIEEQVNHTMTVKDIVEAWRSHGTLHRQAGDKFKDIINSIEGYLISIKNDLIEIPYTTRIWYAQLK